MPNNWNGPYLDSQIKTDPWGNPYQYKVNLDSEKTFPFEIASFGADGTLGGSGNDADIISWQL